MTKLTKKAVLAANEDIQAQIGFKPALDTKLKGEELYKELYQKIIDVEIDEDDRETLEDSTCEVIDALAEKFPDMANGEEAEAVEEDGKEVEEAEAEEVKEEPKKEKKSKKSKKGKVDPAELAEEIKNAKKISRDELYDIVNNNADLFGEASETLLSITNPMVLKKQMRNVLEGGEVEMTKTKAPTGKKKEKKEKEVEVTLTEQVEAFEDLDELKAFAKENKKSFPGVKAKKFDKLKKLQKALLKVVVEDVAPKKKDKKKKTKGGKDLETVRKERTEIIDWITEYLDEQGGKVGRKKLTAKALEQFPKRAKQVRDQISYAKNPKYNKFEKLMAEEDGVIGWEDAFDAPKKGKKAKKEKEVEEVVEKPKKEKKNKKDKKKKKKSKK